nr:uncharacterized protein LOC101130199 [Gorilla gorilla gorilla]
MNTSGCSAMKWKSIDSPLGTDLCASKTHALSAGNLYSSSSSPCQHQHSTFPFLLRFESQSQLQLVPHPSETPPGNTSSQITPARTSTAYEYSTWVCRLAKTKRTDYYTRSGYGGEIFPLQTMTVVAGKGLVK